MLNIQEIRELINLVDQSTIDEFTYETDGTTVSMKKSVNNSATAVSTETATTPRESAAPVKTADPGLHTDQSENDTPQVEPSSAKAAEGDKAIVSPMVGTFYAKPTPESDTYVKKGSKIEENTVVGIVEAMKLFNEIEAETSGEITELLVEDGELVEYGQPLFRVKTV
ncbi:biotin carboxyl carrier protein of acetyl-CoA carboxylase [Lentibacillus kapialis]|uniref:Biotin carboxyl carrier protein of acetyl-CoA carboxylase n=1 Tax=Lentibacillus kapialis TaxID=340214 RepID=A0A917PZ99_9BACI|nr:acetyl-CoA carboxylase biotin carboxyl carrier protein [Lentibacillus kapialis]GGK02741.1 biotin carboxyl carrier protein of acetyl-CoA carboxylase [Lentibacillus kapialis]